MQKAKVIPFARSPQSNPKQIQDDPINSRIRTLLSKASPKIPEHEIMTWMRSIDDKMNRIMTLLNREGGGHDRSDCC